jgi:hypothetical protein
MNTNDNGTPLIPLSIVGDEAEEEEYSSHLQ